VMFSTSQSQSSAMDIMGSRAYQAARAGIEWAAYQIINNQNPANAATCAQTFPQGTLGGTLAPFTVTVTCPTPVPGDSINFVYSVTSVACNAPSAAGACPGTPSNSSYVERSITAKFGK
jgi:MSHA biogenesis protein MshP